MKKSFKRFGTILLLIIWVSSLGIYGQENTDSFTDVPDDHYAKVAIELMAAYGIIEGTPSGAFLPNDPVSKDAFAKMMVLTLGLDLEKPKSAYFEDVSKDHWAYTYVETAKYYMTFWESAMGGFRFKPGEKVVREDMAVAIVKAMNMEVKQADLTVLTAFADADTISEDLKPYVAVAIKEGILQGALVDGQKVFMAQNTVDRAQTATMLSRLIKEEKVTMDEVKTTIGEEDKVSDHEDEDDDDDHVATDDSFWLEYRIKDEGIALEWNDATKPINYYKVVMSETVTQPKYSENGYAAALSESYYTVETGQAYYGNGPDYIQGGKTYYIGITVVYKDGSKAYSNVIHVTMPDTGLSAAEKTATTLKASVVEAGVLLTWDPVEAPIKYYKVVMPQTKNKPEYPTDGYLTYQNETSFYVEAGQDYHDGPIDHVTSGETYQVTITVVYKDGSKMTSEPVTVTIP